jgi:hypothetical protein
MNKRYFQGFIHKKVNHTFEFDIVFVFAALIRVYIAPLAQPTPKPLGPPPIAGEFAYSIAPCGFNGCCMMRILPLSNSSYGNYIGLLAVWQHHVIAAGVRVKEQGGAERKVVC